MAWEQRNGRSYYYRKKRIGDSVVSEYVGHGTLAAICAQTDAQAQQERKCEQRRRRQGREEEALLNAELKAAADVFKRITESCLLAVGFHKHKGEWRRKRNGQAKDQ